MMPYCDSYPCQNPASQSWVDFVEIEAPHWWLWLWYPKYELMDEREIRYGCPEHPIFQRLRMLDGRMVPVPAEFPKSRLQRLKKDVLWALILAVIFAILADIYLPRVAKFYTIVYAMFSPNWILGTLLLLLGLFYGIVCEMSFRPPFTK